MEVESKPSTSFASLMGEPSSTPAAAASTSTAENFFTERNCGYPGALRLADVLADPSMQRWLKREVKIIVSDKEQNKTSRPSKRKKMTDFQDFNDDSFEDGFDDSNLNDGHFFDNEGFDDAKDDVDQVEGDFYGDEEDADWGAFQPKVEMAEDLDMQVVDDYDEYFPEANVEIKSEKGDEEEMGVEEKVGASLKLRKVRKKGKPKVKKVEEDEEEDWADEWTDDWAEDWKDKAPRKKPGRKPGRRKVGTEEEEEDLAGDEFRARTCKLDSTSLDDYVIRFPSGAKRPGDNEDGKGDEGEERCKEEPNSDGEGGESKGEKAKEDGSVFVDKSKPENRRKTYACPFCVYSHKRKGVWVSHLKNRHSDKNIKFCQSLFHGQVCGFPYLKEETLKEHAKCHVRVPIECDICGKTFKMPSQMKQHRQIHMPKNTDPSKPATEHICSFCGKVFGSKTGYRQHEMMVHTKNFKYICDFEGCGKPFFDRTALNTHKNGHLGQSPYVCTYCGAGFAGKGLMKAHEKRVHGSEGEINAPCPICNKSLRKQNLKMHIRTKHQGLEKSWCKHCGKEFPTKSACNRHELIHEDIKKFACRFCGKAFVQKNNMQQHERTHTGEKPYSCNICGQGFMLARVKKEHMKDCQGPTPSLLNLDQLYK